MIPSRIAGFGAVLLLLSGCATRDDIQAIKVDMEEMKTRSLRAEKDIANIRSETREGVEKDLKGFQKDLDTLRKSAADLQEQFESGKVDLRVMAGKFDDLSNQAKKPADEISLMKEDGERRHSLAEKRIEKIEKVLDELQKQVTEIKNREAEKTPDAIYQKGIDTYKANDFSKAREQFTKFIELFPNHDLTANAHYWLGETYYSEKIYDQSILEFEKVIKEFPSKGKAPAALLKQGMAFKELGDSKSSKFVYKKLIENYPLADEVKSAKEKLKELK